jgi:hypothetical protein
MFKLEQVACQLLRHYYYGNLISKAIIPAKAGIYRNIAGFRVKPGMTFTYLVSVVIVLCLQDKFGPPAMIMI